MLEQVGRWFSENVPFLAPLNVSWVKFAEAMLPFALAISGLLSAKVWGKKRIAIIGRRAKEATKIVIAAVTAFVGLFDLSSAVVANYIAHKPPPHEPPSISNQSPIRQGPLSVVVNLGLNVVSSSRFPDCLLIPEKEGSSGSDPVVTISIQSPSGNVYGIQSYYEQASGAFDSTTVGLSWNQVQYFSNVNATTTLVPHNGNTSTLHVVFVFPAAASYWYPENGQKSADVPVKITINFKRGLLDEARSKLGALFGIGQGSSRENALLDEITYPGQMTPIPLSPSFSKDSPSDSYLTVEFWQK